MEFDLSKENIQPLRGGRNVTQLEVALQAQTNEDVQRELMHQKEQFEHAIRNYNGNDPLENWYQYISWVEQSYPKHGHEGNLVQLLEDCLAKFENDKQYINDFRFCKLWIKYNDLQQNPLELYHMMHARGLCRGCTDLYVAWAYYHEAAGDYRSADIVFQLGKRELAQPYEELLMAHNNMIYAAGEQLISGVNEERLMEQRRALMTLHTYKPGKVGSVRSASASGAGILPTSSGSSTSRSNSIVPVYEDRGETVRGAEAAPISILSVAKRQVAPKENTIKPGAWTSAGPQWKGTHRGPKFTVHEDVIDLEPQGLQLPAEYYPVTHEDFSGWKPILCYAEPDDPSRLPMYPKAHVYSRTDTEFSIEEIRAWRYLQRPANNFNVSHVETEQAIQSILSENGNTPNKQRLQELPPPQVDGSFYHPDANVQNVFQQVGCVQQGNASLYQHEPHMVYHHQDEGYQEACGGTYLPHLQQSGVMQQPMQYMNNSHSQLHSSHQQQQSHHDPFGNVSQNYQQGLFHQSQQQLEASHHSAIQNETKDSLIINKQLFDVQNSIHQEKFPSRIFGQNVAESAVASFHGASISHHSSNQQPSDDTLSGLGTDMNVLWRSTNDSLNESIHQPKPNISKFSIYEESKLETLQPKGSAMKSMPFKILSDEELAETGSRGGHDVAAAAQPGDGAKRIQIFEDDSSSSFTEAEAPTSARFPELSDTCNTQMFFSLNAMQVSTPQSKHQPEALAGGDDGGDSARKQLFTTDSAKKRMSTIFEETKSYGSSLSSTTMKSGTLSHSKKENMAVINEENSSYNFNLTQNLKANAALRTSLLELMDCESGQTSPVTETPIVPLDRAPSDPFRPALLRSLLDRVGFPGRHSDGYIRLPTTPRLAVRKELTFIGDDPYYIEKILGKGTYGQVYKATDAKTNRAVALKMQKPPNCWEFYICRELQARLAKHHLKDCFMDVQKAYFSDQISVFVSNFSACGSLLDAANNFKHKAGHPLKQVSCLFLCIEMLKIVHAMHQVRIIHADIKPDNFLVYVLGETALQLQLIDFGCSIDMTFFPPGTTFMRRVTTKDFICCEMQDDRPWNYHTDLFCVAATAHVLLFDKYMQLQRKGDQWSITQRFTRYMRLDLWNTFFSTLLNQQKGPADSEKLIGFMTDALQSFGSDVGTELRKLVNILNNR